MLCLTLMLQHHQNQDGICVDCAKWPYNTLGFYEIDLLWMLLDGVHTVSCQEAVIEGLTALLEIKVLWLSLISNTKLSNTIISAIV